jgi:hypothetical protein
VAAVSGSEPSRALASSSTRPANAARTALQARPAGRALVPAALGNGDPRSPNPVGAEHGDPLAVTAWRAGGRRGVTARAAWIGTRPARPCPAAPHRRAPPRRGPRIRADDRGVERILIVLAKSPVPGRVKTRLCPPATPRQAADLAAAALADTLVAARQVRAQDGRQRRVFVGVAIPQARHRLVQADRADR